MSKIIEDVALEYCKEHDLDCFCSGDIGILHDIYEESIKRGTKPIKNYHPLKVLQKIRDGLRTGHNFKRVIVPDAMLKRMTIYRLKGGIN